MFYENPLSCVTNNGFHSEFFETSRGMRQGCTLSPTLFVVVAEVIANYLRNSPKIQSLKDGNINYLTTQFAEDTTL